MTTKTVSNWLETIGKDQSFLTPKMSELSDHSLILDRDKTIDRIALAIRNGEHIGSASDYDADGLTSNCVIAEGVRYLGGRVSTFVATRFGSGGYGFSQEVANRVKQAACTLVITLDCGSSDHDRIEWLKQFGVDVCVIDHHLVPEVPLPAYSFINPHRPECHSTYKWMASVGLALSVIGGLNRKLGGSLNTRDWLDVCAIGTVADVAPLTGDNRLLVNAGLSALTKPKRPGLAALYELTDFRPTEALTGRDIAFRISPGINAPGRMSDPDIILDLLMEKDPIRAREIAQQVKDIWDKRRLDTDVMAEEAINEVLNTSTYTEGSAIVVGREEWNHGIVGIVAARLVDKFNVPVCVLGTHGRGSLRGPAGSTLYDALVFCKDTLVKFGGHQAAAGCQVEWDNLNQFRQKFSEFFSTKQSTHNEHPIVSNLLPLETSDDPLSVANDINKLEPCGQGNARPIVTFTCQIKAAKAVKGNHLKVDMILPNGLSIGGFGINLGDMAEDLPFGATVEVQGDLRKNTWNGRTKAEVFISSLTRT